MPYHRTPLAALLTLPLLMASWAAQAQLQVYETPNKRFALSVWGMTNVDVGSFFAADQGDGVSRACRNGICLNDTRMGIVCAFDSVWKAKIEICYADKAVSFKDVYIERAFDGGRHTIKLGNWLLPFGQKRLGPHCRFIEFATPDVAMSPNRKIGLAYYYSGRRINAMGGVFSESDADFKLTNQGISLTAHVAARLIDKPDHILQLALTPRWIHPRKPTTIMGKSEETFCTTLPLGKLSLNAFNVAELDVWAIGIVGRFYAEAHYMLLHGVRSAQRLADAWLAEHPGVLFNPKANHNTQGAWAQLSWAFLRPTQTYVPSWGAAFNPPPKTLELALRWSFVKIADLGNQPNRETGLVLGLNYYPNKWLAAKLNVTYTHVPAADTSADQNYGAVAGRLIFML